MPNVSLFWAFNGEPKVFTSIFILADSNLILCLTWDCEQLKFLLRRFLFVSFFLFIFVFSIPSDFPLGSLEFPSTYTILRTLKDLNKDFLNTFNCSIFSAIFPGLVFQMPWPTSSNPSIRWQPQIGAWVLLAIINTKRYRCRPHNKVLSASFWLFCVKSSSYAYTCVYIFYSL